MTDIHQILKDYWGYDAFRPLQEDIIASVLSGHDTLGMLPTGGGKSITFQVPALALGGLCLVVTPLIALMKDQTDHLVQRGIKAAAVYMGMSHDEILETYERVIDEKYSFLYISPERLETQLFRAKLFYMDVRLLVVDEAHCISQWGYDFRPPYLRIADIRKELKPDVPCMALTATATESVITDIQRRLSFRKGAQVFKASFERPNLTYNVIEAEDKLGITLQLLQAADFPSAIIYVRSRKHTAAIAQQLSSMQISADFYHAGLKPEEKEARQEAWMKGEVPVIVTTNAFGMGIDKPDVRLVIHLDLPPSPEEYFQEAGRAGRDGKPARAYIICDEKDKRMLISHLEDEYPCREYIRMVYGRLANFYQIAIGAAFNCMFEFDIYRFCAAYKLSATQVHYALKLLAQAGYIIYNEEPDRQSRLMFTCSREALYHTEQFDKDCQHIINAILRLYTGVFADFVFIRETDLMRFTNLDRTTLYEKLLFLTRFHILKYVPARQKPAIVYLTPRLENEEIIIHHSIFEDRYARQEMRVKSMLDYVNDNEECRLVKLLRYFGEELDHTCGQCDVCRSKKRSSTPSTPEQPDTELPDNALCEAIIAELQEHGTLPITTLHSRLKADSHLMANTLKAMARQGTIVINAYNVSLADNSGS